MKLEQVMNLKCGDILHDPSAPNRQGRCQNWRVNGQVKRWKRTPERVRVPMKHGLYSYGYVDNYNMGLMHLEAECKGAMV